MDIIYQKAGERIAACRRQKNIMQKELAFKIGISNIYLSNIENGRVVPSLQVFVNICLTLEKTPDYFLFGKI